MPTLASELYRRDWEMPDTQWPGGSKSPGRSKHAGNYHPAKKYLFTQGTPQIPTFKFAGKAAF